MVPSSFPFKCGVLPFVIPDEYPSVHKFSAIVGPTPPAKLDRSSTNPHAQMLGNDRLGDCTAAAMGNSINAMASLHGFSVKVSESNAIDFYEKTSDYVPSDPSTDQGADPVRVLTYAAQQGFATDTQKFYPITGSVDTKDRQALANVMYRMGVGYGAFAMSHSDSIAVSEGLAFDFGNPGDETPWSWGGHLMLMWDYTGLKDTDLVRFITWGGATQTATWRWVEGRLFGAFGLAYRQILDTKGTTHLGETWDEMALATKAYLSKLA